ncbi:selenoprotein Pb isoform X3 [Xyrichtys novacula]|nr:selenoprotein Pb isoform X3 [Xyrichtys novacula]
MIVNERDAHSRAMYWELKRRAPSGVPVYQQAPLQADVWEALDGDKDDFLVYDRCGLLTFHIVLPYSFLHYPYIEAAIRATYKKDICNCTANYTLSSSNSGATPPSPVDDDDPGVEDIPPRLSHSHHPHHHHHSHHDQSQHDDHQNQTVHYHNHHHKHVHIHHHHGD